MEQLTTTGGTVASGPPPASREQAEAPDATDATDAADPATVGGEWSAAVDRAAGRDFADGGTRADGPAVGGDRPAAAGTNGGGGSREGARGGDGDDRAESGPSGSEGVADDPHGPEGGTDVHERARQGVEHLQAAARELIAAARAALDVAEDMVNDPDALASLAGMVAGLGDLARRAAGGGWPPSATPEPEPDHERQAKVERIRVT